MKLFLIKNNLRIPINLGMNKIIEIILSEFKIQKVKFYYALPYIATK